MTAALFAMALAGSAHAADLASAKSPEADASKPSCFDSFETYLKSTIRDCPLSYGPLTLYGTLDGGYGYEQWGTAMGVNADKPNYAIQRNSTRPMWLWSPNGLSTSTIGVRLAQKIFGDWELVGAAEAGFNPYTFRLVNGPQSLADNNFYRTAYQRTAFDSARAGQWDNGQGFVGISNPTYGTLTFGRTTLLSQSALGAYDPVASVAFSQIGFTALYATFGASPTSRINTAITYRLTYESFRIAFQAQVGGYEQGNAATAQYQGQVGFDYGKFTFDAIGGWAQNALTFASYGGATMPAGYDPNSIVRATVSNTGGLELLARYQWEKFRFFAGYIWSNTTNPTDTSYPGGLPTIASGIVVPPGSVTVNNFTVPRVLNTVWTGFRYAIQNNLDFSTGIYWETQNNFQPSTAAACTGSGTSTSATRCTGGRWSYSLLLNYRPVPRIDVYGGVLFSNIYGGVASGASHAENIAPTVGVRFRF
ncbi:porin [Rhodoblastus sp.]|uniref:porin n=1 Tax=Rhodoblastus sp. TaxID=1962975 RepID=UPI0035B475A7